MKKSLLILMTSIILVGISIYTVSTYSSSSTKNKTSQESTDNSIASQNNPNNKSTKPIGINPNVVKTKALDFKLKDLDGNEVSLSSLKGKKVFLNFWATWCPPCKAEMPEIEKLYQETKDSDLVILAVDIGENSNTVKPFIDENKYNFKVLLDSDQSVATQYGISSIPTSYFIDTDGNIISTHIGAMTIDQMKAYIKTLDK
ncbi:TlpA family protein disulfide reductase [Clostridium butyricum]|uniref:Redoxin domain-containing protein n=1 Tax=Clostridium butyricum TaxID=1492 RepID=A0A6L9EQA4_CLOBU|nr:TlpA disulfide reductase family protein [Clostridium butyricum]ETI91205.1 MAG: Alkyl hydroperoxide reductase/ Thiol specific antioxidant/ Mal allergen [Clostridium butyricum DORA_1]MDU1509558.1 TlpA disulfide reductase family protein [Clostridium butyricum]MDU4802379.1 TlpA disulfide reductase family protein [Clostridium butyricum]MDU5722704.1 TlpA disulfide reductase family protein [Clostridium butyricum]MDU5820901.1 TlpA disulfide reductase family protein [Clostridium butyricum]